MAIPPEIASMKADELKAALRELKKRNARATQQGKKLELQKRLAMLVADLRLNVTKLRAASSSRAPAPGAVPRAADAVLASIRANVDELKKMHTPPSPHVMYLVEAEKAIKNLKKRVVRLEAERATKIVGSKRKQPPPGARSGVAHHKAPRMG